MIRHLLGMKWVGSTHVTQLCPFAYALPLTIFVVADAMAWIMQARGISWLAHSLDDFVTTGAPGREERSRNAETMHTLCRQLGMPVEPKKDEGPATTISILGLELDSVAMEVRLPQVKLRSLRSLLISWRGRKVCKKRDLLS